MTARTNRQTFSATVNGRNYEFLAYTTDTRYGFCHTVQTWRDGRNIATDTKRGYYNRTWERFDYETVLRAAFEKCPKEDRADLRDVLLK